MKTHDYIHYYRGYWSEGGKCRIRIYYTPGDELVVFLFSGSWEQITTGSCPSS